MLVICKIIKSRTYISDECVRLNSYRKDFFLCHILRGIYFKIYIREAKQIKKIIFNLR